MVAVVERPQPKLEFPSAAESEPQFKYSAIIIPSYGMSEWESGKKFRMSFFSGVVARAAVERMRDGVAPMTIIEGAQIFPKETFNDGDIIKPFMEDKGIPEYLIIQRRDNRNTYDQMEDAQRAIKELKLKGRALIISAHLHRWRVPALAKKYGLEADHEFAEEILSERYPSFKNAWRRIKWHWTYLKTQAMELALRTFMFFDTPDDARARRLSSKRFEKYGADVPDVRKRKIVRAY